MHAFKEHFLHLKETENTGSLELNCFVGMYVQILDQSFFLQFIYLSQLSGKIHGDSSRQSRLAMYKSGKTSMFQ